MILNEITKQRIQSLCTLPVSLFSDIIQQILPKSPVIPLRRYACARPCVRQIQIGRTDRPQRSAADTPAGSLIRLTWFWTLFFCPVYAARQKRTPCEHKLARHWNFSFFIISYCTEISSVFSSPIPIIYCRRLRSERNVRWRRAGAQEGRHLRFARRLLNLFPAPCAD